MNRLDDQLDDNEFSKLCYLAASLAQVPAQFENLLRITREATVKPSDALETHLSTIEKLFRGQFVRNSTRDRKVLRKIVIDLERSENLTERRLGQMFARYVGGNV